MTKRINLGWFIIGSSLAVVALDYVVSEGRAYVERTRAHVEWIEHTSTTRDGYIGIDPSDPIVKLSNSKVIHGSKPK